MGTFADDAAIIQNDDLFGILDGGDTLRNDQQGTGAGVGLERLAQCRIRLVIQRRETVVEDVNGSLLDQGACDGQALFLPAGYVHAALGHLRLHPLRLGVDELTCLGDIGGQLQFLITGVLIAVEQVGLDRTGEQVALLRYEADAVAQFVLAHLPDIHAINLDGAITHLVKARDQADDRGFARAGGANEGRGLARLGGESNVVQSVLFSARVMETDIPEFDRPLEGFGELPGFRQVADERLGFQHFRNAVA